MKKTEEPRPGLRSISPGPSQQHLETAKSLNQKSSPMPLSRSLSATRKEMSKSRGGDKEELAAPDFRSPSGKERDKDRDREKDGSKFQVPGLQAPALLDDAAAVVANLVNTAVPSLAKAFTRKKGKDGAVVLEEEAEGKTKLEDRTHLAGTGPAASLQASPSAEQAAGGAGQGRHRTTNSEGNLSAAAATFSEEASHDVVMGVLYKWINLGRGWGPRLFVLEGGVLSYYKLDGPDKASVRLEVQKHRNPFLLGEDIRRCLHKEREKDAERGHRPSSFTAQLQKPLGTVHLLVANIRESKSDDKKFYVYSGTKTLDLRAETREDRAQWVQILEVSKLRMDESMKELDEMEESRYAALSTVREDAISRLTGKLREGGVAEATVSEFEEVLRNDVVGGLQKKLREEKHRRWQLQRRIKELETDKLQLETAVVEETRSTWTSGGLQPIEDEDEGGTGEDSSEEGDISRRRPSRDEHDAREEDYFEALSDFMESRSEELESQQKSIVCVDMEQVGFDYPIVPRRASLPEPAEKEKPVSLWAIIKDCVGKDVSRITLPVFFNEPISTAQKCAEEMEYSWLLDRAAVYGNQGNQVMRALHVAAFALSGYACTEGRPQKPFNPLLGETYEAEYPDKGWRFLAEKMQHNPNVVACHCDGRGWTFWGDCNMRIRFWGPSMQLDPLGVLTVEFEDGERYEWSKVTTGIYNLILGKLYIDHYGTMTVASNRNDLAVKLKFKERSMFDRNIHQVQGFVQDSKGKKLATLIGKWSEHLYFVLGDAASGNVADEKQLLSNAQLLWKASPRSEHCGKYKFTPYCVTLNEMTPGLKDHLPPTDSRLRADQRLLELGKYDLANEEKLRLEQKQREARKSGEEGWHGRYFEQKGPHNTWTYNGKYWDKRARRDWSDVKDLFSGGSLVVEDDGNVSEGATLKKYPSS